MPYYRDLRDYIATLEEKGKLVRIKRLINKDTELHPLVRWQFRGLPDERRRAFFFENVTDVKGKKYNMPVLVGAHAASRDIYALAMACKPDEIMEKWSQAELHPVEPVLVDSGPVMEEIHKGAGLLEHGGMGEFPVPISTPGFDNAPYLTAANWVSRDPETGIGNMGNYRAMVKSPNRLGICATPSNHFREHWERCRNKGIPLEAAIVLGCSPNLGLAATARVPYGLDEYKVAGGISGVPVELVRCQTVNLEVPAHAEIIIEGIVPTDYLEREAPFGEFPGYMGTEMLNPFMNITCIMHRKHPIFNAFISQFPPSESSKLRGVAQESVLFKFLKHDCNIPGVKDLSIHEASGANAYVVIALRKTHPSQAWQALNGTAALIPTGGKVIVAVDDDIDPRDADSVNWAISFRMQPHRDVRIIQGKAPGIDPSAAPLLDSGFRSSGSSEASAMLIDATTKWPYPPISLPRKEFMENARRIWEEEDLPELKPKVPWYGYSLGHWTAENQEEARLALNGDHYVTGEKLAQQRVKSQPPAKKG